MMKRKGTVYLIGAGPGDAGLITIRGLHCLHRSDAVIYDHLVPYQLLTELEPRVELIDAGKQSGKHTLSQDEINKLIVSFANAGKTVARLKGGDPLIFGRGGEEAMFLKENGIPYEIIPGITAAIAAGAYAGIPLTHRGLITQTLFVTAHEASEKDEPQVDWELLARLKTASIAGYMGVKTLPIVTSKLLDAGMNPETPAAVIRYAATPMQTCITGKLKNITDLSKQHGITPPALFIIGESVTLRSSIEWFENKPLSGRRIVVTRAAEQAGEFISKLSSLGAYVIGFPTIRIEFNFDNQKLEEILERSVDYQWLIFTSENGVKCFFRALMDAKADIRSFQNAKIAAVGSGTAKALQSHYMNADFIPSKFLTESLATELAQQYNIKDKHVLRIKGIPSPTTVEDILTENSASVDTLIVYETRQANPLPRVTDDLISNGADLITFTSSSTARNFVKIVGKETAQKLAVSSKILAIGPVTSKTLRDLGLPVHFEAETHTIEGMIEEINRIFV
ncbi:MAG: uroporphyrinogen-III C-methyltransferase [candidate division Zixibacteria bacterium]|nr:uroporphyrinogen-III C-methyltransferase [candidate division Zixibacteria bacterium]